MIPKVFRSDTGVLKFKKTEDRIGDIQKNPIQSLVRHSAALSGSVTK